MLKIGYVKALQILVLFFLFMTIRRDFFIEEQKGIHSLEKLDSKALPGKTETVEWYHLASKSHR